MKEIFKVVVTYEDNEYYAESYWFNKKKGERIMVSNSRIKIVKDLLSDVVKYLETSTIAPKTLDSLR